MNAIQYYLSPPRGCDLINFSPTVPLRCTLGYIGFAPEGLELQFPCMCNAFFLVLDFYFFLSKFETVPPYFNLKTAVRVTEMLLLRVPVL